MTITQFFQALVFLLWFLTIGALSTFSFFLGNYVSNPNYQLWIIGIMITNVTCAVYWFNKATKWKDHD